MNRMLKNIRSVHNLPFYPFKVAAGFPSPADDHLEESIDLIKCMVHRPASTFVMQVTGESMKDASIADGDYVVVDRSITPKAGHIVVASLNGEITLKYFIQRNNRYYLSPANTDYLPIALNEDNPPEMFGVVTGVFRLYG